MSETTVGREPVQLVEIVQPLCANTFGVLPCTATAAIGGECFNTRSTCQDPENYDGSSTLSLIFGHGNLADRDISGAPYVIPSLVSVSTIPSKINLGSTDRDSSGLGQRARVTAVFEDHPGSDKRVDPYVSTRTYAPLERGSWWTKWLARNLYRYNIEMNVYEGYIGQALGSMQKRSYVITDVTGPGEDGRVNIKAKDFLSVVEERKAQVPRAQGGELFRDASASQDRLTVIGAAASDYSASGWIQIDDEIIRYSSITSGAQGTIVFRVQTRGAFGSTAAAHDAETKVQEVGVYNNLGVDTVVKDLLTSYAGMSASKIDTAGAFAEEMEFLPPDIVKAIERDPRSVFRVLSSMQEQFGFLMWWDERDALVKMRVLRGYSSRDTTPVALDDLSSFIEGSFRIDDMPDRRVSQVWFYHTPHNYHEANLDSPEGYQELLVYADLASEGADQYGQQSIKKIFGRYTTSQGVALSTASKIVGRYRDVPRRASFKLDAKDRSIGIGDIVTISHYLDVDQFGVKNVTRWLVTEAEEEVPGEVIRYVAEDITSAGIVADIQAAGAGDYNASTSTQFEAFIGDADGLLSDGSLCARINA